MQKEGTSLIRVAGQAGTEALAVKPRQGCVLLELNTATVRSLATLVALGRLFEAGLDPEHRPFEEERARRDELDRFFDETRVSQLWLAVDAVAADEQLEGRAG